MPAHEIALPAGSKNLSPAFPTITRYSKDGDIPVIRLFGGDNFIGDILEGNWLKGDDGVIVGPHTSLITGGQFEMTGKAAVAANYDYGWLNSQTPFLMIQNAYIDIHLKVPAVTPTYELFWFFYLQSEQSVGRPNNTDNWLRVFVQLSTVPAYEIKIQKNVNGTITNLYDYAIITNPEGTFRIKFRPDDNELDIYFHDGAGDIVESSDELTLISDILDLAFTVGYPAYEINIAETTNRTLISEKIEVSYPDFDVNYDLSDEAFQGEGSELLTKAFDTSGNVKDGTINGATWIKDGKYGKALHFNGASDNIGVPSTIFDLSATTFTWWCKRDVLIAEYPQTSMAVLGSPSSSYAFIIFASTGNLQIETNTNADAATGVFTDDKDVWHHYAIVCDNYVVTFYEDGIDITSEPTIVDDITLDRIGRGGSVLSFEGILDDIRIYDSVLTQANVQAIMADNPPAGAIREYLFDGGNTRGDVVCYDTRGETDESLWQRVYTEDHEFSGDCMIENGLIRILINEANQYGTELYYWDGSMWSLPIDVIRIQLASDAKALVYPFLKSIVTIDRAEKIQIHVRVCDSSDENSAYYLEYHLTLMRGSHHLTFEIEDISLEQNVWFIFGHVTPIRWAYCGDVESKGMGDYDFLLTVSNNVMTDNFMLNFDDALSPVLGYVTTNEKPAAGSAMFHAYQGGYIALSQMAPADFDATKIHCGLVPFRKIANLFEEAEDGTLSGSAAIVADGDASGGYMVELDAQHEYVYHELTGITDIPLGRYLLIARVKDTNQIASDLEMSVYNSTDSRFCNEEMAEVTFDLTAIYAYYSIVFDIMSEDSGDTIEFYTQKGTVTANTIKSDYFLIIPIGDGESFPQDIAHSALRSLIKKPKLIER